MASPAFRACSTGAKTGAAPDLLVWSAEFFIKEPRTPDLVGARQDLTYWGRVASRPCDRTGDRLARAFARDGGALRRHPRRPGQGASSAVPLYQTAG